MYFASMPLVYFTEKNKFRVKHVITSEFEQNCLERSSGLGKMRIYIYIYIYFEIIMREIRRVDDVTESR